MANALSIGWGKRTSDAKTTREGEGERHKLSTGHNNRIASGIKKGSVASPLPARLGDGAPPIAGAPRAPCPAGWRPGAASSSAREGGAWCTKSGASMALIARFPPAESPATMTGEARKPSAWS